MANEYLNNKAFEAIIDKFQTSKRHKVKFELILEDLQDARDRKAIRGANAEREQKLLPIYLTSYGIACTEFIDYQKQLAQAFYTLAEHIIGYAKFGLIDPDDAMQDAVLTCFEKIDRFDPRKGKAFNYQTTLIINSLRQSWRTIRSYNEFKKKYHGVLQDKLQSLIIHNGKVKYHERNS